MADYSKPIAFCEHLQLSSLGVQPASISFQVRWRDTVPVDDVRTYTDHVSIFFTGACWDVFMAEVAN